MPTLRPANGRDDDRRPVAKPGGGKRLMPILLVVGAGLLVLICVGVGVMTYTSSRPQMTMVDGSRERTPQGGTTAVTLTLRAAADSPGGRVSGKYYFVFSSGSHTNVADANVVGRAGVPFRQRFFTPDLASEPGPVTFWVEQRDGESVSRVSPEYTIP